MISQNCHFFTYLFVFVAGIASASEVDIFSSSSANRTTFCVGTCVEKAEKGDAESQYFLAAEYLRGKSKKSLSFDDNEKTAFKYYKLSAEQQYAPSQYMLALGYLYGGYPVYDKEGHPRTMDLYLDCKDKLSFYAVNRYGKGHHQNVKNPFSKTNVRKAVDLLEQASKQNYQKAQVFLGGMYFSGLNVKVDYKKAFRLLESPADKGDPEALMAMGYIYQKGLFIPKNLEEADKLYDKAKSIVNSKKKKQVYDLEHLMSIESALGFCSSSLEMRAYRGDLASQLILMEDKGRDSMYWAEKAAKQGSAEALYKMSTFYKKGLYVSKNSDKEVEFLEKAADKNNPQALYVLGDYYAVGKNVTQNNEKAIELLTKAASFGLWKAAAEIGDIYYKNKDYHNAYLWYQIGRNGLDKAQKSRFSVVKKDVDKNDRDMLDAKASKFRANISK